MADEMLGPTLLSIHNLTFYQRLMNSARQAIEADQYSEFLQEHRTMLVENTPDHRG
jgi:queuine tRNA-ribosyltransferase